MSGYITVESVGATEIVVRNQARLLRLADLEPELMEGSEMIYAATREWYDSAGGGTWPALAPATIAAKASQGMAAPDKPLYAEGNLYESATSASGPYSFRLPVGRQGVLIGVDWERGGWQIPVVHYYGTFTAGRGHHTRIPPRPIWPSETSPEAEATREALGQLLLRGI